MQIAQQAGTDAGIQLFREIALEVCCGETRRWHCYSSCEQLHGDKYALFRP
jgi:hypothetical protein